MRSCPTADNLLNTDIFVYMMYTYTKWAQIKRSYLLTVFFIFGASWPLRSASSRIVGSSNYSLSVFCLFFMSRFLQLTFAKTLKHKTPETFKLAFVECIDTLLELLFIVTFLYE